MINLFSRNNKIYFFILIALNSWCNYSYAEEPVALSVGLNTSLDFQAYKGKTAWMSVLPTVFYDNKKIYVEGDELGVYLLNNEQNQFRLNAYYDDSYFNPSGKLNALRTRKWSVMSGASYMRITPFGGFKAQIGTDILSRSKGTVATLSYLAELNTGKWSFYPEMGYQWSNSQYNDYYYGVTASEARNSGLTEYHPQGSLQPYMDLNFNYNLNKKWNIFGGVNINYLSNQQYRSPMVRNRIDFSPSLGIVFKF
ncbi:MipA/OmpV family protein [Acinetobacter brisouii]|uniref:MipA/OmpV family protein n=1 Tax=Acinetobacter brisouii TaxID=396323 RepID=UPI0005F8434E|nr:MipA/OmpV family protein [Acinetobacter brisouii]KJV38015.1 MltA-interacting protein MipA [Acinetobacter brisouii]